jgi:alkanesulfonate monooxygenase SsuD/methylene tetrahydromethanopterin reductase-like flavin-dependent oxidoreductase (luciferase family)
MGAKGRNFYNDLATRYGYGEAAAIVQDHYLAGRRDAAIAAVPDGLIDETNLIGSPAQIRDRLDAWREAGVSVLSVSVDGADTLRQLAQIAG